MKHISIIDFVAEQNRFMRTDGLAIDDPNGQLEPFDMPLSSQEKAFWDEQEDDSMSPYETEEELKRLKELYELQTIGTKVMKNNFFKVHSAHINGLTDSKLTDVDKKIIELERNGGMYIYKLIYRRIVRKHWKDHKGFPVKKDFYNKHLLACTIPIRVLCKESGFSDQKIQKILKQMNEVGLVKIVKNSMNKRQTVFVLGTWYTKKEIINKKVVNKYYESLYFNTIQNDNKVIETESNYEDFANIDFSEMDMVMGF